MNSMLVCSGIGSCKRANGILSLVSQTRNAGGGGRPGGAIGSILNILYYSFIFPELTRNRLPNVRF